MKETLELRINSQFADLLFRADEGRNIGTSVKILEISKDDPRYNQIPLVSEQIRTKYDKSFYFGWKIIRKYSTKEIEEADLFCLKIKNIFEPTGEECGTLYDESTSCEFCGANRKQKSTLVLKPNSIPKKDISKTIGGEIVVSERFTKEYKLKGLKGALFQPVILDKNTSGYYQLIPLQEVELSSKTIVGINPFDLSISSENELYKCPEGHTLGLNLLSEPYILNASLINNYDFLSTKQKIGVKRGLLRPEPLYLCSPTFRNTILSNNFTGFDFEKAHIE